MTTAQTIAQRYIDLWNERDETRRSGMLAENWTADAHYVDPLSTACGVAKINTLIGGVQQRFPEFTFSLIGTIDGFGDHVRFSWSLGPKGSEAPFKGTDFLAISNGKINSVTGFLDQVPPVA